MSDVALTAMVTVSKPAWRMLRKAGHHVAVVHFPAVLAIEVLPDVAPASEASTEPLVAADSVEMMEQKRNGSRVCQR